VYSEELLSLSQTFSVRFYAEVIQSSSYPNIHFHKTHFNGSRTFLNNLSLQICWYSFFSLVSSYFLHMKFIISKLEYLKSNCRYSHGDGECLHFSTIFLISLLLQSCYTALKLSTKFSGCLDSWHLNNEADHSLASNAMFIHASCCTSTSPTSFTALC
jgi:hypothetical protein